MAEPQHFRTLAQRGVSEEVVERSRFLGFAYPVDALDDALELVAALRKEHYDARHVCFGLRIGHGAQRVDRSNDDGEPARTGGYPIWQLLEGDDLTDALVVVVRYFGGVKLGTGGLARAYRGAARAAIDDAGVADVWPTRRLDVAIGYDLVGKFEHWLGELGEEVVVADKTFAAYVTFHLDVRLRAADDVRARLAELLQRDVEALAFNEE